MKNDQFNVNEKHLGLRTAAFVLALIIAVGAFSLAISSIGKKEPGYSTVEADADGDALFYASGIEFKYYFTGESNEIKQQLKLLREEYSTVLRRAYKLLDPETEYEGYANIATINNNPGTEVELNSELYAMLRDAWEKTRQGLGFNMFAGALNAEWQSILSLDQPEEFDPAVNENQRLRIEKIAAMCANPDNFSLEFSDEEKYIVCLTVSEEYKKFAEEMELGSRIIDMGVLRDAYELALVRDVLESKGYDRGYFVTAGDLIVNLSAHQGGEYVIYAVQEGEPVQAGAIPVSSGSVFSLMKAVQFSGTEDYFYILNGEETLYRHPYFSGFTGGYSDLIAASYVISPEGRVVDTAYLNLCLQTAGSISEIDGLLDTAQFAGLYCTQADGSAIFINPAAAAGYVMAEDSGVEKKLTAR